MLPMKIRPARREDADAAIPLLYSSGPAVIDYILGTRGLDDLLPLLRNIFRDGAGELGYRNHIVAEGEDQRVVGLATGYGAPDLWRFTLAGTRQMLQYAGPFRGAGIVRRAMQVEKLIRPPKAKELYIAHLGVAPEYQSHGIGARLVEHLLQEGHALGRTVAALDVALPNTRAIALYQRLGFTIAREAVSSLPGIKNHFRMEYPLR